MHLFAEMSSAHLFIVIIIFVLGTRQWVKWFAASPLLRKGAKMGLLSLFGHLFKK